MKMNVEHRRTPKESKVFQRAVFRLVADFTIEHLEQREHLTKQHPLVTGKGAA